MNLETIKVGDKFSQITYQQYGSGVASAYDYIVIRAGKRDVVANAMKNNCEVLTNVGDGKPREFKFRRTDDVYEIGAVEVAEARKEIAKTNRHSRIVNFLQNTGNPTYDEEFMVAVEAFMKRRGT